MADYLDQLLKVIEKGRVGENGTFKVTEQGRENIKAVLGVAKEAAYQVAQHSAREIAAVAVDLMMTGIDESALKVLSQGGGGMDKGVFAIEEGDSNFGYTLSNSDANLKIRSTKFNPADAGRFGKFFEEFFYGLESESGNEARLPDLAKLAEKYGEVIRALAPELKVSTNDGDIHVGGQTVGTSSATFVKNIKKKREVAQQRYLHKPEVYSLSTHNEMTDHRPGQYAENTWIHNPMFEKIMSESGEVMIQKGRKMAKEKVEKAYTVWAVEVEDFVQKAVAVVKLLQKVSALMVMEVDDMGIKGKNRLFEFKAATVFAKLDVDAIVAGLEKEGMSFSVRVDKTVETAGNASPDGKFTGSGASVEISIKNPTKKDTNGQFKLSNYKDNYSLWSDRESRDKFFSNMYKYLKENDMFAVAKSGSAQEDFNMEKAISRMENFRK